ncbi:hypothetical protein [Sphingobacterium olei]|nr:hypothetical protein [Sphingobacterium olei]
MKNILFFQRSSNQTSNLQSATSAISFNMTLNVLRFEYLEM